MKSNNSQCVKSKRQFVLLPNTDKPEVLDNPFTSGFNSQQVGGLIENCAQAYLVCTLLKNPVDKPGVNSLRELNRLVTPSGFNSQGKNLVGGQLLITSSLNCGASTSFARLNVTSCSTLT